MLFRAFSSLSFSAKKCIRIIVSFRLLSAFLSLFPFSWSTHSHPYSLSVLLFHFPIPSLLYSALFSPFPLCSTAYSHPYSLSALQLILVPVPFVQKLIATHSPSLLYSTAHPHPRSLSAPDRIFIHTVFPLNSAFSSLFHLPAQLISSLFPLLSYNNSHPYSLSALQRILIPILFLLYSIFSSLIPLFPYS
jgi:hypothetical protein